MKIVTYLRVSTVRQGRSGLGLEAQRSAIQAYANARNARILKQFVEVESGNASNSTSELLAATYLAKVSGSLLVIVKMDRLSRDAALMLPLRESRVKLIAADMPDANEPLARQR